MEEFPVRNMMELFDRLNKLYTMRTFSVRSEIRVPSPLTRKPSEVAVVWRDVRGVCVRSEKDLYQIGW